MTAHVLSLLLLALMFVVASTWSINLGILALVGSFLVGSGLANLDADDILAGFPGDLFVLLVGVTYLFGIAQHNGTLGHIVHAGTRAVGERRAAMPWLMFVLAAFVASAGALSAAAVAIVAPLAMRVAERQQISSLLMGLMVVQGATAGSFSPLSPFGAITNDLLRSSTLPFHPANLFATTFAFNLVLAGVVFVVFGGLRMLASTKPAALADERTLASASHPRGTGSVASVDNPTEGTEEPDHEPVPTHVNREQIATLCGIGFLVCAATLFGLDVGFTALTIGLVLTAFGPERYSGTIRALPWSAVLLVCGMLTYVEVLDVLGTIDYLREIVTVNASPLITALAASYIGGIISAFASTAGVLGASIPMTIPLIEAGTLPVAGTITAVAIASSVVDVSPLSTNGALLVANQRTMDGRLFFRRLLTWAVPVIALTPAVSWLLFVVL